MADEQPPGVQCEDVAIDEARRMGRGPRMEPTLYDTLRQKIASLSTDAVRIHLGPEITQQRMRHYILHIARELGISVTIRRVPSGLTFWRSSEEDLQQAKEAGARLQTAQRRQQARPRGRRPRSTREEPAGLLLTTVACKTYIQVSSGCEALRLPGRTIRVAVAL
jgi:hypothetical protein